MCGIFCLICRFQDEEYLLRQFKLFEENLSRRGPNFQNHRFCTVTNFKIQLASSVLWLQGKSITNQPLESEHSLFVYNGDVLGGIIEDSDRRTNGDTKLFLQILESASQNPSEALEEVHGPYAFIHVNSDKKKISFGRDVYGRRSLLIGKWKDEIILSSVAKKGTKFDFIELPSIGIFTLDLESNNICVYPWKYQNSNFEKKLNDLQLFLDRNIQVKTSRREDSQVPFMFEIPMSHVNLIGNCRDANVFDVLLQDVTWSSNVMELKKLLELAIKQRISAQPSFCQNCVSEKLNCSHSLTGVLFSGGVDCAILALLADKFMDKSRPIDLINVAFDRVKDYKTPDRATGLETLEELKNLCPDRVWNFVGVDVAAEELDEERRKNISDLIYPLTTVLDDSLGCALWFASRAKTKAYTSPCRVLLVGMGADELFGGYTRHRAALKKDSWEGLQRVLVEDWQNLSHRNLARDDRVVSDHGRQLRTPYLDENLVRFIRKLHPWEKTHPSGDLPQGIGEKILLRTLAHHLGLSNAAKFKKRALQFGSRIANPKENAHSVSLRL